MKNVIYQYWDGDVRPSAQYGSDCMKEYADRIGCDYIFETNARFVTNLGAKSGYYGCFKPVFDDKFLEYDNVLFADTDVFPVDGLEENIFETFTGELGMATEPLQPYYRSLNTPGQQVNASTEASWKTLVSTRFGSKLPVDDRGRIKTYNSGVVLYSNAGLRKCREQFVPFKEYLEAMGEINLASKVYGTDQGYLHAMAFAMDIDFVEIDNEWNRYITWDPLSPAMFGQRKCIDPRTENTKMVHVQMRGADNMDNDWHWRVVNEPVSKWGVSNKGEVIV
jgi:hypothetical protein